MPRGRKPGPGTAEEKAAIRREKVRLNVQAYRRKRKEAAGKVADSSPHESTLTWVEDSKWQNEYEQQDRARLRRASQDPTDSDGALLTPGSTSESLDDTAPLRVRRRKPELPSPIPVSPNAANQYSLALLAMFPERFLPAQLSLPSKQDVQTLRTPCALWVTTAVKQARRQESGALSDVLHSIVLAVLGMNNQRLDLQTHAQRLYTRSLAKTRRDLGPMLQSNAVVTRNNATEVFLACHASAVYELLVNGSMEDMLRHITGVGLLIEHTRGSSPLPDLIGDSLIEEYRQLEIHFCLMKRKLSTFGRMQRQDHIDHSLPHKEAAADTETTIPTRLLALADQILPVMVEFDSYTEDIPATAGQLMALIQRALSIHTQLESWSTFLHAHSFPSSPISETSSDSTEPIDLCQITQYEFASCYLFSLSYDLHAVGACIEAVTALTTRSKSSPEIYTKPSAQSTLLRTQALHIAHTILELMPYFFQPDKGIIGRSIAIWPLEAVWKSLDHESARLADDETYCASPSGNASDDFRNKTRATRALIAHCYRLCRQAGRSAKGFGLPLLHHRSLSEDDVGLSLPDVGDVHWIRSRVKSVSPELGGARTQT
jgi:hypothetical protein